MCWVYGWFFSSEQVSWPGWCKNTLHESLSEPSALFQSFTVCVGPEGCHIALCITEAQALTVAVIAASGYTNSHTKRVLA